MNRENKFVSSYSGGKDSVLALYRAVKLGGEPLSLITTYNEAAGRSWFHGVPLGILDKVSNSLNIPIKVVTTGPADDYGRDFERALIEIKDANSNGNEYGIDSCVFGDIDIQAHHDWCDARCVAAGIDSIFPLWNENRASLVYELIDLGFKAVITIVNTTMLSAKYLGKTLTRELAAEIAADGADICGENGEYHSFVYDGPLFTKPIDVAFGEIIVNGEYSILPICPSL
jgi:uncharacterized protein (TIGR00290 family)